MKTFKQHLCEIGNSKNPYPYKITDGSNLKSVARFKTESGHSYWVDLQTEIFDNDFITLKVDFGVDHTKPYRDTFSLTNAGLKEAFRVMATVISSVNDVLKKRYKQGYKTNQIAYQSSDVGKGGSKAAKQREKLYLAFIKKNMKHMKYNPKNTPGGFTTLTVKDSFYK